MCWKKTKKTENKEKQHEGKSDDGGTRERRAHGALILAFKDDPLQLFTVFALPEHRERRETEVSTCTSLPGMHFKIHIFIFINYSINPEKYSAV